MMPHLPPFAKAMLGLYAIDSAMPVPGVFLDVNFLDLTSEIQALEHVDERTRYQVGLQLLTEAGEERFPGFAVLHAAITDVLIPSPH